jgi:demethylmenaquinone methyltransferase/2-methoxy-6-polyprenyl-1,4-benzoquinol methylase
MSPQATCFACDFTWEMLALAKGKSLSQSQTVYLAAADAQKLPFPQESFDAVTVAFGVRNLEDLSLGLSEFLRVLRAGGCVAILEFTHPHNILLKIPYAFYLHVVIPVIGRLISSEQGAYRYLADSIAGFPDPEGLSVILRNAGFSDVSYRLLTGGIVAIYLGTKPQNPGS